MSRIRFFSKVAFLCAAAALAITPSHAQSTTQGGIAGTIEDTTGAAVPGAAVTVHSDATNAEQKFQADSSGNFRAPLVDPGIYTVTVSAPSFATYIRHIEVQVGVLTEVSPKLSTGGTEQTIEVTADAPVLNFDSPEQSSELTRKQVDDIPIQIRRWSALALTTPGVTADNYGFGLISVRGMATVANNVEIDGADDNQAFYSEERGRTRAQYSTSPNAVQEFQVNAGVYSAQYGRALGAVINSVTRSGANQLHGELVFQDLDRGFGAYVPGLTSLAGTPIKLKDLKKIYGGGVGGAIIKDKLFWWYTYDQVSHINNGYGKPKSPGFLNGSVVGSFLEQPDSALPAGYTCNLATGAVTPTLGAAATAHYTLDGQVCALAARTNAGSYAGGVTNYDNGLGVTTAGTLTGGGIVQDLGIVPRRGYQEINTPKLDWQINQKHRASFLYHRLRWDGPGYVQTAAGPLNYAPDAWGQDGVKLDYGVAKLESSVTSHISNELIYQYGRELNYVGQQAYTNYTLSNLISAGTNGSGLKNAPGNAGTIPYVNLNASSNGFYLGSPYYSYRQAYPDERKWQIEDTLYWNIGNHSLRMGGDFVHNSDLIKEEQYYFGYYSYANLVNFLSDLYTKAAGTSGSCGGTTAGSGVGTYDCYTSFTQSFGQTAFSVNTTDYAGFVQDNWKATPHLTLELGVRYDYESIPGAIANLITPVSNTAGTQVFFPYSGLTNHPQDFNNIGPRIGFAYDVFGNGLTLLHGGYGLYYGRINNATIESVAQNTGSAAGQYALGASLKPFASGSNPAGPVFPTPIAGGSASATPSSMFYAPNLQSPAAHEFDMNVQQALGKGTVFQISYLGSLGRTLPNYLNVNLAPPTTSATITVGAPSASGYGNGPLPVGNTYSVPQFSATYINPHFGNISEVLSNINSNYNAMVFEVQNKSLRHLSFDVNYTWAHALDFLQNSTSTATGSSNNWLNPYANARQNYGISTYNVGNRVSAWALYTLPTFSHNDFASWFVNGWAIDDQFQAQNGLPYSAQIGSGSASSVAANSGTWNGINGVYYLPPIGLNTYQVPRVIVDDLRLMKHFNIKEKYDLQLFADMYNVANHQNFSTNDVNQTAYNFSSTGVLSYIPKTAPNVGFGSFSASNDSGFLYTPREFQISARLEF